MSKKSEITNAIMNMYLSYRTIRQYLYEDEGLEVAFNNSKATEIYPEVFSRSFDEISMCKWCTAMIVAIENAEV